MLFENVLKEWKGGGVSSKKESDSTKLKVKSCYLKLMMMWKTNSRYPRIEELPVQRKR